MHSLFLPAVVARYLLLSFVPINDKPQRLLATTLNQNGVLLRDIHRPSPQLPMLVPEPRSQGLTDVLTMGPLTFEVRHWHSVARGVSV